MLQRARTGCSCSLMLHTRPAALRNSSRRYSDGHYLKSELELAPLGRSSHIIPPTHTRTIEQTAGSPSGGPLSLRWLRKPRNILLIKKPHDSQTLKATRTVISHLRKRHPEVCILVEQHVANELRDDNVTVLGAGRPQFPLATSLHQRDVGDTDQISQRVDLAVCLGGDGTVLHFSSLCSSGPVPPVIGLSLGNLGFLMPYSIDQLAETIDDVFTSRAALILRMRLRCSFFDANDKEMELLSGFGSQAINEIHLHRGRHPHMTAIEAFVDGQLLTEAVADGLIVATPTGSTAYSLSAGGPIVHPSVQSLILTPISPRSLSFRPLLLPPDACISLRISPSSRSPAEISLDGRDVRLVRPGQSVRVTMSSFPVPCFIPMPRLIDAGKGEPSLSGDPWLDDIQSMLSFNRTFKKRGLPDEDVYDVTL